MSTYHSVNIAWSRANEKESYSWTFDNGLMIDSRSVTAPTNGIGIEPESALVAAVTSSHMIAFLETCALEGIEIIKYQDRAVGFVVTNQTGQASIDHITLSPHVEFSSIQQDPSLLSALHQKAHSNSLVAKSIHSNIEVIIPCKNGIGRENALLELTRN